MNMTDARDDRIAEKALRALAASSARWVYHPNEYSLPYFMDIEDGAHCVKISFQYKHRKIIYANEYEQAQKATFTVNLSWNGEAKRVVNKRVFVLSFRGTVTEADWLANLAVTFDKEAFKSIPMRVHTGFSSLVCDHEQEGAFLNALREEWFTTAAIDCVLFCGHSLGGALAQVAALRAWQHAKNSSDPLIQTLQKRLRCITIAAPQPFAPPSSTQEATQDQRSALEWMLETNLNYVNNNDVVPRLPGNMDFVQKVVRKSPTVSLSFGRATLCQTKLSDTINSMTQNGSLSFVRHYRPTCKTIFIGHNTNHQSYDPHEPGPAAERLSTILQADPGFKQGLGFMDWYSGGLLSIVEEHGTNVYVERVFISVGARDHFFGHGAFTRKQGVYPDAGGNRYEGQRAGHLRHGQGLIIYANGDSYEGQWVNDKRHGKGVYTSVDGNRCEGQWENDQPNMEALCILSSDDQVGSLAGRIWSSMNWSHATPAEVDIAVDVVGRWARHSALRVAEVGGRESEERREEFDKHLYNALNVLPLWRLEDPKKLFAPALPAHAPMLYQIQRDKQQEERTKKLEDTVQRASTELTQACQKIAQLEENLKSAHANNKRLQDQVDGMNKRARSSSSDES